MYGPEQGLDPLTFVAPSAASISPPYIFNMALPMTSTVFSEKIFVDTLESTTICGALIITFSLPSI